MSLGFPVGDVQTDRMYSTVPDHVSKDLICALSLLLFLSLSSSVVGGITTRTGLGICTLTVHMRTPALNAVLYLTPAALLFPERCVLYTLYII